MVVLSLFDGIACGRIALERADIKVDKYYASEIDPDSIKIAKANYRDIIDIGDVTKITYNKGVMRTMGGVFDALHIDLIIGGSPCTDFSSVGYANGMKSGQTDILSLEQYLELKEQGVKFEGQSYLFWEYVRLLNIIKPDYYLLENVYMSKKWQKVIDDAMGTEPIGINSDLVSAQNRPRLYWTNIKGVIPPKDKNIILDDILDKNASVKDVSDCQTVQKVLPLLVEKYGYIPSKFNAYNVKEVGDKACALSRGSMVTSSCATLIFTEYKYGVHLVENGIMDRQYPVKLPDGRYNLRKLSIKEMERLQTLPDGYTSVRGVGSQKRSAAIGNGWTVDVIAHILSSIKEK